jgi:hypothetical protein
MVSIAFELAYFAVKKRDNGLHDNATIIPYGGPCVPAWLPALICTLYPSYMCAAHDYNGTTCKN